MNRFSQLLEPSILITTKARISTSVSEQQQAAKANFPAAVRQSFFSLWKPGDAIQTKGQRLLIGVGAAYSGLDMKTLDEIEECIARGKAPTVKIDVFDICSMSEDEKLSDYIPQLDRVYNTPIVGEWVDGEFKQKCCGVEARRFLGSLFGINDLQQPS